MPAGRPSEYTKELGNFICDELADGKSLRAICREEGMPNRSTVNNWLLKYPTFYGQYVKARDVQADNMFDEILDIADLNSSDYRCDEYGNEKPDHEHIARSRLRIDTRKWYLSKVLPKKYGERQKEQEETTEIPGGLFKNGDEPI